MSGVADAKRKGAVMFTRKLLRSEVVTTRKGEQVTVELVEKTRNSTGTTVYEVRESFGGSVDARKLATAEKNFTASLNHWRTRY